MRYRDRLIILGLLDSLIVTAAVTLSYFLRFDFQVRPQYFYWLPYVITGQVALMLCSFFLLKLYKRVLQYASIGELVTIIRAVTISEVAFFGVTKVANLLVPDLIVPRSIYILSWALIILGVGGSRFFWRMFRDSYITTNQRKHKRNLLIIGAGNAGALIVKELKKAKDSDQYPVAFIDDDRSKHDLVLMGLPVLGGRENIPQVVEQHNIEDIVIAIPSAAKSEIAEIIKLCKDTGATIKIMPSMADLISGRVSVKMIRDVSVEDLLGRDPVQVDLGAIAGYVTGQTVLVTGAGGSIGSELCRQVSRFDPDKLLLLGHGENSIYEIEMELRKKFPTLDLVPIIADIQDKPKMRLIFEKYHPAVVFHAAAHKHVPLMELNPSEAVKNNVLGTKNVAECADEYQSTHFVMISSDKAVNPTSVMGTTKRIAEMVVQGLDRVSKTKFVAVRFGNVLGSRGSVIPIFKRQIQEGGPVTVTHPDMVRYFMTIPEAVQLVIQAGALAEGGEIFILDMGEQVKIVDLARDLIRLSGLRPDEDIKIAYTGIRPGEKLFEEILTNEEGTTATKHDRIFVGKPLEYALNYLMDAIFRLEQITIENQVVNPGEIKDLIWSIVPKYVEPVEDIYIHSEEQTHSTEFNTGQVIAG